MLRVLQVSWLVLGLGFGDLGALGGGDDLDVLRFRQPCVGDLTFGVGSLDSLLETVDDVHVVSRLE